MTIYTDVFLWTGIALLLFGYIGKYRKHETRMVGYVILGLFWVAEAPYFFDIGDIVNATLCLAALPLFSYFAYHEFLSRKWDEDPELMKFIAGSISISMLIYYSVQRIPLAAGFLTQIVAQHTNWILSGMGYDFTLGAIEYGGNPLFYRVNQEPIGIPIIGSGIRIIFACTALQTLAPAGTLLALTAAEWQRKIKSLIIVLVTVYIANLLRNVMIVYLTYEDITSFEVAHHQIAKVGSVIVLVILMLIVFEIMPEFYDNIIGIVSLPKREKLSAGDD